MILASVVLSFEADPGNRPPFVPQLAADTFYFVLGSLLAVLAVSMTAACVFFIKKGLLRSLRFALPDRGLIAIVSGLSAILLLVFFLSALAISFLAPPEELGGGNRADGEGTGESRDLEDEADGRVFDESPTRISPAPRRNLVVAFVAVVGAAIVFFGYRLIRSSLKRGPQEVEDTYEEMRQDLAAASLLGLETMLSTSDNRQAIIAAYAIMEDSFARNGHTRELHQTPMEYMTNTIRNITFPAGGMRRDSLLELTRLYEIAKFSDHKIVEQHRAGALRSLRRIQRSLTKRERSD